MHYASARRHRDRPCRLNLSAPGVSIQDGQGVGTIIDDDRDGAFSCTATAADVIGITAGVANPNNLPCADDSNTVASATLNAGLIRVTTGALTRRPTSPRRARHGRSPQRLALHALAAPDE
ncbi:MAG TPA: hypothetical protein VFW65_05700 [Pseudonocardiaceae bacterium]|nr:hypothetical protein [Pseudonocardiaceae bacterium]